MSSNWSKSYPEPTKWVNRPGTTSPIDEINLNKISDALNEIDDRVLEIGSPNTFTLSAENWNYIYDGYYPYMCHIDTDIFTDDSVPIAIVTSSGKEETTEEHEGISYIKRIWVDSTGITVYAESRPTVDLILNIRGK